MLLRWNDETITHDFLEHSCLFILAKALWLRHTTALDKPKSNLQPKNYATKTASQHTKTIKNQTIIAFSLYTLSIWASAYPHNISMPSKNQSNHFRQHQCPPPRHPSQGEVVVNGPDRVVKSNCLQCQIASPLHQQRKCPLHYGHVNFLLMLQFSCPDWNTSHAITSNSTSL